MTSARDLADRFHKRWLEENPFTASMYGIPGYDDLVPDDSEEGQQAWRAEIEQFLGEAAEIGSGPLTPADAVTLDCTREAANYELDGIDMARAEYTVTPMPYAGPAAFLAVAARTVLLDPAAAEAYLTRLRRSGAWIDQNSDRLRAGAGRGRLPVAPLIEQAIGWAEGVLAAPGIGPVLSPQPPQDWARAAAWEEERRALSEEVVRPALERWVATISELLPQARPSEQAGLVYLPGGEEDYARAVRIYTTLPLSPEQLHRTGLDHVAALEARMTTADLARSEHVKPQSMGTTLADLEQEGLVQRRPHPTDGRQVLFELTAGGIEARRQRHTAKRAWLMAGMERLEPAEQQSLIAAAALIKRLAES